MRQYRGRIKDSTVWVYGYYTKSPQGIARIWSPITKENGESYLYDYVVDPETVGQSIGRKDMHGTEVYDGDILEEHYTSLEISRYKVEWDQESAMWVFNDGKDRVFAEDIDFSLTEVKGNKWDHPHLLKGVSE